MTIKITGPFGTADSIATTSGVVNISGTPPTTGQIIKATSPTTATWQADATGGGGGGITTLAVANIDDPSIELNAIQGAAKGDTRLCYQVSSGADAWTIYVWDDADSSGEAIPYRVDGSAGMWAAVGGKYHSQDQFTSGSLVPSTTGTPDLGSSTNRWQQLYAEKGIQLSELASAPLSGVAGRSQYWTKSTSPSTAWFDDDVGNSYQMGALARVAGSTYFSLQHLQNTFHSVGYGSGGSITDDTDGTITVSTGTGFIRATDSPTAEILFFDWPAESGANVNLTGDSMHWIYAEYNSGSPRVVASLTERSDFQTNVLLGTVYLAAGTTMHITEANRIKVGDHASEMVRRMKDTAPFARVSGGVIGETGTRNVTLSAGNWWQGLTNFTTSAVDTSGAGTFEYFHPDGSGGWTELAVQTQIDNLQYYNSGAALSQLANNRYGVHWVYLQTTGELDILYGLSSYTLSDAEDAPVPSSVPPWFAGAHARLIGKIIIGKSASLFTSVESVFDTTFEHATPTDHSSLLNLTDPNAHTQYLLIDGTRAMTGSVTISGGGITANADADETFIFGRSRLDSRFTDRAIFSHYDYSTTSNFAVSHTNTGELHLNAQGIGRLMTGSAVTAFVWDSVLFRGNNGGALRNSGPSAANPTLVPAYLDPDTGVGWASADILTAVTSGIEACRWDADQNQTNNGNINVLGSITVSGSVAIRQDTLISATNVAVDGATSNNFEIELTQNIILDNPINVEPGIVLNLAIRQDVGGGNTVTFGDAYKFPGGAPTVTSGTLAEDLISCYVRATISGTIASTMLCSIAPNHS